MPENFNKHLYIKRTQNKPKEQQTQETMNELEVSVWLVSLSMIYTAVCWFYTDKHSVSLVAYVLLLIAVSWAILRIKKKVGKRDEEDFVLSEKRASALFSLLLLGNSLYFLVCGLRDKGSSSISMAITNALLYVGFAVSLEKLFEIKRRREVFCLFFTPFADFCRGRRDWVKVLVAAFLIIFLGGANSKIVVIIVFAVAIIMLILMYGLNNYRKKSLSMFCKFIISISLDTQALIWEIGGSSIVRKQIQKELFDIGKSDLLVSVNDFDERCKWDLIIVLNSTYSKAEYIPLIKNLDNMVVEDGFIIDPFISKGSKRKCLLAWLGIPNRNAKKFSIKEYMTIVQEQATLSL